MNEPLEFEREQRNWSVVMHLSILLGNTLLPVLGWLVPFIIWQLKKDDSIYIDQTGRKVNNFLLNLLVFYIFGGLLTVIGIGFLILVALWFVSIVLPIVAAIKESKGQSYDYPSFFSFLI